MDLAEQALRTALPTGREFLRVLVDEGGTATAECLEQRELQRVVLVFVDRRPKGGAVPDRMLLGEAGGAGR